jgi:hypothetical protein
MQNNNLPHACFSMEAAMILLDINRVTNSMNSESGKVRLSMKVVDQETGQEIPKEQKEEA